MATVEVDSKDVAHLARLALAGRRQDVQMFLTRFLRKTKDKSPDLANEILALLKQLPSRASPFRDMNEAMTAVPIDNDSRLRLLRFEHPVALNVEPIWAPSVKEVLEQVLSERQQNNELMKAGLLPTKSMLFTGKPGVGKTLAAHWLASKLGLPLLILDLSAVMSSFLGRTGVNVKHVFEYAKGMECVLLIDELDATAKRRDDVTEIGELKRLVTVLIQEIDDWSSVSLLIAATNHPALLDPAIWRRFDSVLEFPMPNLDQVRAAIGAYIGTDALDETPWLDLATLALHGLSYGEIETTLTRHRRNAIVHNKRLEDVLENWLKLKPKDLPRDARLKLALGMVAAGHSQRQVREWTGVSRDTIRKAQRRNK